MLAFLLKTTFYSGAVLLEYMHPVRHNFFHCAIVACWLLVSSMPTEVVDEASPTHLRNFVFIVAVAQVVLEVDIYSRWWFAESGQNALSIRNCNPTYQIAMVANFVGVPPLFEYGDETFAYCLFSVGVVTWVVVFLNLFQSLSQNSDESTVWRFPTAMYPTLFLFVAPPSAAAIAWTAMVGSFDYFGSFWFFTGQLLLLIMLRKVGLFLFRTPPTIALWAYTFPTACAATAGHLWAADLGSSFSRVTAWILTTFAASLATAVFVWTVFQLARCNLFGNDALMINYLASLENKERRSDVDSSCAVRQDLSPQELSAVAPHAEV
jgi:tellurite resistance protein TehA-like permease